MNKKTKCFARLQGISKWKKHTIFFRTGANNFQTDSLKAHKVHEASEGRYEMTATKRASERPREERPLPTLPAALSRLKPKTAVDSIKTVYIKRILIIWLHLII